MGCPLGTLSAAPEAAYGPTTDTNTRGGPVPEEQNVEETVVEETLVEEVSIDGMCGVY
jgi:mycofactocin precursor